MKRTNFLSKYQILDINQYLHKEGYDAKDLSLEQSINFYNEIKFSNKIAYATLLILIAISFIVTGKTFYYISDSLNIINLQDGQIIFAFVIIPIFILIGKFIDYFHKLHLKSLLDKYKINKLSNRIKNIEYKNEKTISPEVKEEIKKIRNLKTPN